MNILYKGTVNWCMGRMERVNMKHKRLIYIALMMFLAFLMFACSIEYARHTPITDEEISKKVAKNID